MSEQSLDRQTSEVLDIPERCVVVKDASELPTSYCQTPGGTIFSTTPGGKYGGGGGACATIGHAQVHNNLFALKNHLSSSN